MKKLNQLSKKMPWSENSRKVQVDNLLLLKKQGNISTNRTTKKIKRTPSISPSRTCKTSIICTNNLTESVRDLNSVETTYSDLTEFYSLRKFF